MAILVCIEERQQRASMLTPSKKHKKLTLMLA